MALNSIQCADAINKLLTHSECADTCGVKLSLAFDIVS